MRAKFINEKFGQESESNMNAGYGKKQLESKTWKILEFIESKGEEGAGLTEIQHYIWTELDGKSEESFWETQPVDRWNSKTKRSEPSSPVRKSRGHWNTQLFGGMHYHKGILHKYCERNPNTRKWVLVKMPKPGEVIYDWPKQFRSSY